MQVHFGTELLRAEWKAAVACVGTFDGVHVGHQTLLRVAVERSKIRELPSVVVTFDRHPVAVLAPHKCPKALESLEGNLNEFRRHGIAVAVVLPFDERLSQMSAERFLDEVLVRDVRASELVVGHDFAMGQGRRGTTEWLKERIPTDVVPPFEIGGVRVSSSAIRWSVSEGDLESAAQLLGRPFAVSGVVVGGQKLGRKLGYPTANIARSFDQVLPAHGIYAGEMTTPWGTYKAAASIGTRPAVGGVDRTIEAYLLDYPGHSLYGEHVRLNLLKRLREEKNFPTIESLIAQIEADVSEVREYSGT